MADQLYQLRCPNCGRGFFVSGEHWEQQRLAGGTLATDPPANNVLTLVAKAWGCFMCRPAALPDGVIERVVFPLVVLANDAPTATRQVFARAVPGSVYVYSTHTDSGWVYYEGGVGRNPQREPTLAERVEYVLLAAERALWHGLSVARVALPETEGINIEGGVAYSLDEHLQPCDYWVWWENVLRPLWLGMPGEAGRQEGRRLAYEEQRQGTERFARQQMGLLAHALGAEQCRRCARYRGEGFCEAFPYPGGIPEAILAGEYDHAQPYEGDRGLLFVPAPSALPEEPEAY